MNANASLTPVGGSLLRSGPLLADLSVSRRTGGAAAGALWEIFGRLNPAATLTSIPISEFPFTIGRHPKNLCTVAYPTVSGQHAVITLEDGVPHLRDLNSTNGTFINGTRLEGMSRIKPADVLQFGTAVFTVNPNSSQSRPKSASSGATVSTDAGMEALAHLQFDKLLADRAVVPFYQPIVRLSDQAIVAFEVLARSRLVGLEGPAAMFRVAGERGVEGRLSQLLRQEGVRQWQPAARTTSLYLNTHPAELIGPGLLASLQQLRAEFPTGRFILEIHEATATNIPELSEMRSRLRDLDIGLAYDDFGAGQSRLAELADVPPEVLKFDINLVRGLGEAPTERRMLVRSLVEATKKLGVLSLAEGIETPTDAATCKEVGFDLAQGYFYGAPAPAKAWSTANKAGTP